MGGFTSAVFQGKVDVDLSNLAVEQMNNPTVYLANFIAPIVPVENQTDKFVVWGEESLEDPGDIIRGPAAAAIELKQTLSRDSYNCEDHAASRIVPLQEINAMAQTGRDPRQWATRMLIERVVNLKRELALYTKVGDTAEYNASNKKALAGTAKWSDFTQSDPIGDVIAANKAVALGCGFEANRMVLGWDVFEKLKGHPAVKDRLVHVKGGAITLEDLQNIFEIPIRLASARKRSAAGVKSFAWPAATVWIGYVSDAPSGEDVSFAKTFLWRNAPDTVGGVGVEDNIVMPASRKARSIDVHSWHSDGKIVVKDAAYLLTTVV